MKSIGKLLAAALLIAVVGWVAMYLFWHVKIVGAIRSMETGAVPGSPIGYKVPDEPLQEVRSAGCRALPYLVSALDAGKSPAFLVAANDLILQLPFGGDAKPRPLTGLQETSKLNFDDTPADRARKIGEIRDWWRVYGGEYHQTWRVWSSQCAVH